MNLPEKFVILLRSTFYLLGLYFIYGFISSLLHTIFPELDTATYEQGFIMEMLTENPFRALIMIVVVAPVTEEMMFRSLLRPSHTELVLFIAIWPVFFLLRFIPLDVYWGLKLAFAAIFLFCVVYISRQVIPPQRTLRIRNWLISHQIWIWIITSLVFGFVHITNYVDHFTINLALFLLIMPRILAGFMIGWVKINNKKLQWAMALHAINNGIAFFFIYVSL
ncbi:type II CAAX prenyl endopeptidase Rce1 family protein [Flavimarina sp. Hel_I_48]|uniref:CPBP family glutamic-type intramembrane protease n=1 Tax=Flavimarina sp. Hel_I_48 TaxID=1392488 RepID=UPI00068C49D6|nr:CPBP family glutamic-type intramembrane protease [Flavimarina sp. Hel_I_48]